MGNQTPEPYSLEWWLAPENRAALREALDRLRIQAIRQRTVQAGPPGLIELLPHDYVEKSKYRPMTAEEQARVEELFLALERQQRRRLYERWKRGAMISPEGEKALRGAGLIREALD